ncbi:imidazole glycerol phosphate synthase subunit HisF [Fimbriimonadia bacterium ATM]|nr:MAG: imidazole glycerol phosphate synthase subunit HisF [Armatimonadota bacterium]MBC6969123.1 imidazole glycerol phosphate synthase subunit HisF [Armatimonadota bacterium]MCE7900434.1 imidazole glycerol phosphate synthase subunit HisF [Armatimonadetes bacterium ATM1]MDL1928325.1 imidazole glycerol phosphate synthase subunit HisF [Fimbriimonadia bacterium ATM]RIJ94675.1 MAG: imidazole glycerol phosphate synthase subunit HisF [Armatimonadota bacterium]
MLTKRVIPCLDVDAGRVVKGVRFQNLRDAGDPAELAAQYERQGADEIVLLDVSATNEGRRARRDVVAKVREAIAIPLTVGGGIRDVESAREVLEAGADKVSVNTAAVEFPEMLREMHDHFGAQCVVLALDAARVDGGWEVMTHSGTKRTGLRAAEWAKQAEELGAGEILLTSWDRDGTRSGYDLDLISNVRAQVRLPIIASGGAAGPEHMIEAYRAGADAVLAASIFHDGDYSVEDIKRAMQSSGLEVRL